jgi:hypothetical protein
MDGMPCIRRLRIPVATVVGMVAEGMTKAEILSAHQIWRARTLTWRFAMQGSRWAREPPFQSQILLPNTQPEFRHRTLFLNYPPPFQDLE